MATQLISTTEAARILGITSARVRQLREEGLPAIKVGRKNYVYERTQILAYAKIPRRKAGRPKKDVP